MYRSLVLMLASIAFPAFSSAALYAQAGVPATLSTKTPHTEDWTTISLAKSGLALSANGGVRLSKIEQPGCTRELLRFEWRSGDPIDMYVIRPRGVDKPPVILYLFNYTSDIDVFRADNWCKQVAQDGIAAVGFVSALAGQRFHAPRPMKEWFVSELQEALATSTHDVQMILNYLSTRGDLDMKRVGVFGQGSGGSIAILAAAADPRIVAIDVIDPWGDWPDWLKGSKQIPEAERATYLKPEFLNAVARLDPVTYLPQLKERALRIQQLLDDPVTPPTARDKIAEAMPQALQVLRYKDRTEQVKAWDSTRVLGWLGEQLKLMDRKATAYRGTGSDYSKIRVDVPKANAFKLTRPTGSGDLAQSPLGTVTPILL